MTTVRLQLSRKKGFRLKSPNGLPVVVVSRPSPWGNPYWKGRGCRLAAASKYRWALQFAQLLIANNVPFENKRFQWIAEHLEDLRGKNLACWCPLDIPDDHCHAGVLLELANL